MTDSHRNTPKSDPLAGLLELLQTSDLPSPSPPDRTSSGSTPPSSNDVSLRDLSFQAESKPRRRATPSPSVSSVSTPAPTPVSPAVPPEQIQQLQQKLRDLETRLDEATGSMGPLMPVVQEILSSISPAELRNETIQALVPSIDRVIRERTAQNSRAMHQAFADILPGAIAEEIERNPQQIANAIGPEIAAAIRRQIQLDRDAIRDALASEMGRFIKAQIELERDAMVDALYPVIGNTIAKYMGEAIREINTKVENTLSFEGINRKIRARIQGVSEAELILRESFPFCVKAAFLIHKSSGLVISEAQISEEDRLESDMVAGMLTAIRSFAADCMVQPGSSSELNEIEYDTFKLVMEVAGYCYVAVVTEGEIPKSFITSLRQTLSYIVERYGDPIEQYDGDPDTVPPAVGTRVQMMVEAANVRRDSETQRNRPPILLGLLGLFLLGWGIWGGWRFWQGRVVSRALAVLRSQPALAVYRLDADMEGRTLVLSGEVPTDSLRSQAEDAVNEALPQRPTENRILAIDVPPPPEFVAAEVQRVAAAFNAMDGVQLQARMDGDRVALWGELPDPATANRVSQTFEGIPGVKTVVNTIRVPDSPLDRRVYFKSGQSSLTRQEQRAKLEALAAFLVEFPQMELAIVGHTDEIGSETLNQKLARERAENVKATLVELGVAANRLQTRASIEPPPNLGQGAPPELSRCVRWEILSPNER